MCEGQGLPSQGLGLSPWPFCFIKQAKGFLSIAATCTVPLPTCNRGLQFSALRSPWGGFVSNGPQWGQSMLPGTFSFASAFLSICLDFLSASEVHGLNTKYPMGVIKIQKVLS